MATIEVQIHGYRKGHQLLASSLALTKDDQAIVDRLSDVAGPLRPKEEFAPYLSAYPLPSGTYYVVARTWQDSTVARAGCVRTKSLLVDAELWSEKPPLIPIFRLLSATELPTETEAIRTELEETAEERLSPVSGFNASELLEALFLEDVKPVVVFDAPNPELIALRLLSALWPAIRRRFALSTFALSPRRIDGHDLDLVFAPSNARAKFSDWPGRRLDGRASQNWRHKWTPELVRRVFEDSTPQLLSNAGIALLGEGVANSTTALRIGLVWEELLDKLGAAPTSALGLLDIANSGMVNYAAAVKILEPRLAEAIERASNHLTVRDTWDFIGAITRKVQRHNMPAARTAVEELAERLAERAPDGALELLWRSDPQGAIEEVIPGIARGLGKGAAPLVEQLLINAPPNIIARLVAEGGILTSRVAKDDGLIGRIGIVLTEVDHELGGRAGMALLPYLVEDRQLFAAKPIFGRLAICEIAAELLRLRDVNNFGSEQLVTALIDRGREVDGLPTVRDVLLSSHQSERRDALLALTVAPINADLLWILNEKRLSDATSRTLLTDALRRADDREFTALLSDQAIGERVSSSLYDDALDMLVRAAMQNYLPINAHLRIVQYVLPRVGDARKIKIAEQVIGKCLCNRFEGDEVAILTVLLSILGEGLDGRRAVMAGLGYSIGPDVASRNMVVFEKLASGARARILEAVDEIAQALLSRQVIGLTEVANEACARIMLDAENTSHNSTINAAGWLLPSLIRAREQPVSQLIRVLFPVVYRVLATNSDVPQFLRFVPFLDWDRCKAARRELVEAFMSSSWKPSDLALTAIHCNDLIRIFKRIAKSDGGDEYLARIENDLVFLHDNDQRTIRHMIDEIRSAGI